MLTLNPTAIKHWLQILLSLGCPVLAIWIRLGSWCVIGQLNLAIFFYFQCWHTPSGLSGLCTMLCLPHAVNLSACQCILKYAYPRNYQFWNCHGRGGEERKGKVTDTPVPTSTGKWSRLPQFITGGLHLLREVGVTLFFSRTFDADCFSFLMQLFGIVPTVHDRWPTKTQNFLLPSTQECGFYDSSRKREPQFTHDSALPVWELLSMYRPILYLYSSKADLLL